MSKGKLILSKTKSDKEELNLEDIIEDVKILLDEGKNIGKIMQQFNIPKKKRSQCYAVFQRRYGNTPSEYKSLLISKRGGFVKELNKELRVLERDEVLTLAGIMKIPSFNLLTIISKDENEFRFLTSKMCIENGVAKPGKEQRVNGFYIGIYEVLDLHDYKRYYERLLIDMKCGGFSCRSRLIDEKIPLIDKLDKYMDLLIKALYP